MEKTRFYPPIWTLAPFSFDVMSQWYNPTETVKELILKNELLNKLQISEMELDITKFVIIDDEGKEHQISDFNAQSSVLIKGMSTGSFLKTSNYVDLQPGKYAIMRFYVSQNESLFTANDGLEKKIPHFEYLDFALESTLEINEGEKATVKLWFNLVPFEFSRHFKPFTTWFKRKIGQTPRLVNNLG